VTIKVIVYTFDYYYQLLRFLEAGTELNLWHRHRLKLTPAKLDWHPRLKPQCHYSNILTYLFYNEFGQQG